MGVVHLVRAAASVLPLGRLTARTRASRRNVVRLDDVRRRLELLVTAVFERPIPIAVHERPRGRVGTALAAMLRGAVGASRAPLASTDGERIQLPRSLRGVDSETAMAQYRLMALEQAARVVRGTADGASAIASPVERDLFLMHEGVAIDASLARDVPGIRDTLQAARDGALAARPPIETMLPGERRVERLLRTSLMVGVAELARAALAVGSPADSLAAARRQAHALAIDGRWYRGLVPVALWGLVRPRLASAVGQELRRGDAPPTTDGTKYGVGRFARGGGEGGQQASEWGREAGTTPTPSSDDGVAQGGQAPSERSSGAGDGAGHASTGDDDSTRAPDAGSEARDGEVRAVPTRARSRIPRARPVAGGIAYPEWDWEAGAYRSGGAIVRAHAPAALDDAWGDAVLAQHGPLVRYLRERFERLRARRVRLLQQRDGDALDLAACVRALVDQRTGHAPDDRLYIDVRPARRGLAIALLIDISGSTDERFDGRNRVIDVAKVALLVASEALDALGDAYTVLAFSGKGPDNVRIRTIKEFGDVNGALVRRRIAALEPEGYTRAGAAMRHAVALLEREPAAHRLLLVLSDGKPNDVDWYEGPGGVEDMRQAVAEARQRGVFPFCLTIDREGGAYLARIFGEAGHTILRNPHQLPTALVKVVRQLLGT